MVAVRGARILRWALMEDERRLVRGLFPELFDFSAGVLQFRCDKKEVLAELDAVGGSELFVRLRQQLLCFKRQRARNRSTRVGCERDAEAAERRGIVATKEHLNAQLAGCAERFGQVEDSFVPLAFACGGGPAGFRIAIGGECGSGRVVAEVVFAEALGGADELHFRAASRDLKLAHEEVALAAFVVSHAGAVGGEALVGQGFEAQRGDTGGDVAEG